MRLNHNANVSHSIVYSVLRMSLDYAICNKYIVFRRLRIFKQWKFVCQSIKYNICNQHNIRQILFQNIATYCVVDYQIMFKFLDETKEAYKQI